MRRILALATVLLLAACGSSSHAATPTAAPKAATSAYADVNAVHDAMTAAGLDCTDFKVDDDENGANLGPKTISSGSCTLLQESIALDVYKNAEVRGQADGVAQKVGCDFAKGFGISKLAWVSVANWTATGDTSETAKAIEAKLGGKVHEVNC